MVTSRAAVMEIKLAIANKLTLFKVRGIVQINETINPMTPKTIVQVPWPVTVFIIMENVRM